LPTVLFLKEEELADTLADFVWGMSEGKLNPKLLKWLI
jgi:hypothetical protein